MQEAQAKAFFPFGNLVFWRLGYFLIELVGLNFPLNFILFPLMSDPFLQISQTFIKINLIARENAKPCRSKILLSKYQVGGLNLGPEAETICPPVFEQFDQESYWQGRVYYHPENRRSQPARHNGRCLKKRQEPHAPVWRTGQSEKLSRTPILPYPPSRCRKG